MWMFLYIYLKLQSCNWRTFLCECFIQFFGIASSKTKSARGFRQKAKAQIMRANPKPAWVKQEIIRLKALMPDSGCRKIAAAFNREFTCHQDLNRRMRVSKSYVANIVRANLYAIEKLRKHIKNRVPHAIPKNLIWAIDLTGKGDTHKNNHHILGLIDHGSRALLNLHAITNKTSWTLLGHLFIAIGKYGKPKILKTDNERCFTSHIFTTMLHLLGIKHQRSKLHSPWQNGRIERLFLTLKQKLDQIEVDSIEALNNLLGDFHFWYNHVRPHQHLNERTPAEAWSQTNIYAAPIKEKIWFETWHGLLHGFYLRR